MHDPANETQPTSTVNAPAATATQWLWVLALTMVILAGSDWFELTTATNPDPDTWCWVSSSPATRAAARAADAVEQRDQLRHLGHRDQPGRGHAHRRTDHDRDQDQRDVVQVLGEERHQHSEHRAEGADLVAASRGLG